MAHSRLFAAVMACISPVKCRLISSMGTTWEYPPPAAPPLMPNTGPKEGSRNAIIAFFPILAIACPSPTEVVVFPSPAGVGLMAVTRTSLPSGLSCKRAKRSSESLALYLPYGSSSSGRMSSFSAISVMGSIFALCAISISLNIVPHPFLFDSGPAAYWNRPTPFLSL